jgi:hypothetical protein
MKAILKTLLISSLILLFTACIKENHTVRFTNNYHLTINSVHIGTAFIGTVDPGQTSQYVKINAGNFQITGTSSNGGALMGSGTISGKGKHKWTVALNSAGTVSMMEDKK